MHERVHEINSLSNRAPGLHLAHVEGAETEVGRNFTFTSHFGKLDGVQNCEFWIKVGVGARPFAQKSGQEETRVGVKGSDRSDRIAHFVFFTVSPHYTLRCGQTYLVFG